MNRRSETFAAATAAIVLSLIWVATVRGQAPSAPRAPMAEEVFKNIQVLKGIPVDQFMGTMGIFASAVGKNCTECHGQESGGDWARYADDTPLKQTARRMVLMMQQINRHQLRRSSGGHLLFMSSRHGTPESYAEPGCVVRRPARRAGRRHRSGAGRSEGRSDFRQVPDGDRRCRPCRRAHELHGKRHLQGLRRCGRIRWRCLRGRRTSDCGYGTRGLATTRWSTTAATAGSRPRRPSGRSHWNF